MACNHSLFNLLSLNDTLTLLAVDGLLLLLQAEQSVDTGNNTAQQTSCPGAVGAILQPLSRLQLAVSDNVHNGDGIEGQVTGVTELATDTQVAEDGINGSLVVQSNGGSLQVLGELADTQDLTGSTELLLDGIVGVDGGLRAVGAVQVPGVEAGEVLDGTEELIAANCGSK